MTERTRFDLLEEIERELKISLHPMTWPINSGKEFKGVYDLFDKDLLLFTANTKAADEGLVRITDLSTSVLDEKIGEKDAAILREDIELVEGVHGELNVDDYLAGKVAPLFFGSAINNFGVKRTAGNIYSYCSNPSMPADFRKGDLSRRRKTQRFCF